MLCRLIASRCRTNFQQEGGWTRQTTVRELGTSVELAGVNMRLDHGVIRELHWHKEAEWAYVLDGEVRVTALDYEGGNFIDDLKKGDLWVREITTTLFKMASNRDSNDCNSISQVVFLTLSKASAPTVPSSS